MHTFNILSHCKPHDSLEMAGFFDTLFCLWNALIELRFLYGFVDEFVWVCMQLFQLIMCMNLEEFLIYGFSQA